MEQETEYDLTHRSTLPLTVSRFAALSRSVSRSACMCQQKAFQGKPTFLLK